MRRTSGAAVGGNLAQVEFSSAEYRGKGPHPMEYIGWEQRGHPGGGRPEHEANLSELLLIIKIRTGSDGRKDDAEYRFIQVYRKEADDHESL